MKLSIIIPVYNVEQYLEDCLESIRSQSFTEYEILLIDDGSTDRSPEICDRYAETDPRIRVIHSENKGVSNARNLGIEAAQGEYILFIDADDLLAGKDAVRDIMHSAEEAGADLAAARSINFQDGKPIPQSGEKSGSWHYAADSGEVRLFTAPNMMMANLYARRVIGEVRFDTRFWLGEDCLFLMQVIPNAEKAILCDWLFYLRRLRPGSAIHSDYRPGTVKEKDLMLELYYANLHGKPGGDEVFEKYFVDQTILINSLMPEHKRYRNEVRILRGRIRKYFPHYLGNRLIPRGTKVFLTLFLISPDLFYAWFKPYKRIKQNLLERSRGG